MSGKVPQHVRDEPAIADTTFTLQRTGSSVRYTAVRTDGEHRLVPVSQAFWWPSEVTEWRCRSCAVVWSLYPTSACPGRFTQAEEQT